MNFILSGGLDDQAAKMLNLPPTPVAPIEPYMDFEPLSEESLEAKVQ